MNNSLFSRIVSPTVLLYAFVVISNIGEGIYRVTEGESPAAFALFRGVGFLWIVGWWMRRDSKLRNISWVYDMGMFLFMLWPFILPYYLIKSRGARALFGILGFAVAYLAGLIVGVTIGVFLTTGSG